jgi:hypothetical protein
MTDELKKPSLQVKRSLATEFYGQPSGEIAFLRSRNTRFFSVSPVDSTA